MKTDKEKEFTLVKITKDNDGEKIDKPKWHFVHESAGCWVTLCTGEAFGYGVSAVEYKTKPYRKGGITCPECIKMIKWFKSIPL